jgi:ParB family transcriptional regulator, chromosome partitioning protein
MATKRRHVIAGIKVGKRHRKDYGDIASLAASMDALGLLQPIVVTSDGKLIAGARRLKAAKQLGWTEIPVFYKDDLDNIVRGEHAENTERKDFTLTEAVAIKRELEPLEKKAAKGRQQQSKGRGKKGGQVAPSFVGRAADKAAKATGKKRRTLEKLRPSSSPPKRSQRNTVNLLPT